MGIKDANTISTKAGDKGASKDYTNKTYPKDDILFDTLGTIDELSAVLGLMYHRTRYEQIKVVQRTLQAINSLVATDPSSEQAKALRKINENDTQFIENEEEKMLVEKEIEPQFHLPGSETSHANAYFDFARTVCRRAERTLVKYINEKERDDLDFPRAYLNRLSDLLFILARNFQVEK